MASGIGAYIGLAKLARPGVLRHAVPLRKAIADAEQLVEQNKDWVKNEFETKLKRARANPGDEGARGRGDDGSPRRRVSGAAAESRSRRPTRVYPAKLEEIRRHHDEGIKKVEEHYPPRIAALKEKYEKDRRELDESYRQIKDDHPAAIQPDLEQPDQELDRGNGADRRGRGRGQRGSVATVPRLDAGPSSTAGRCRPRSPRDAFRRHSRSTLTTSPTEFRVDPRLKSVPTHFELPALLPFPIQGSMLIKAADAGKDEAIVLLQSLMLRYLTSVPPGKVRFTIIDPVGLGENFAAFMHLGDYHELLVTNRIWTEAPHIEQRLTDLTEHMENVIQKYLRNEFETIEEYNTMAGEVAEPFRVLVVANFPTNFNDDALRRLVSIVNSGARCGVYALDSARHQASACRRASSSRSSRATA